MSTQTVRLHRWDEIALEKVTEMLSRKIVTGEHLALAGHDLPRQHFRHFFEGDFVPSMQTNRLGAHEGRAYTNPGPHSNRRSASSGRRVSFGSSRKRDAP